MLFNKGYAHSFEDSGKGWAEEEEGEKTMEGGRRPRLTPRARRVMLVCSGVGEPPVCRFGA